MVIIVIISNHPHHHYQHNRVADKFPSRLQQIFIHILTRNIWFSSLLQFLKYSLFDDRYQLDAKIYLLL